MGALLALIGAFLAFARAFFIAIAFTVFDNAFIGFIGAFIAAL
jgi:hypothetical protein